MEQDTTMAQGLHVTDDRERYDAACKRVLSQKSILARIMKASLAEFEHCDPKDIEEKYIEGTPQVSEVPVMPDEEGANPIISGMDTEDKSVREGTVTYDIRFYAIVPGTGDRVRILINVEAQQDYRPGYPLLMRAVYYCCRMISAQYGREFTQSHYEKLKKVCSIWICMDPPRKRKNTITRYRLVEEHLVGEAVEPVEHYDLMSIVMLCLGGPEEENYEGVLRLLDVLLTNRSSEAEKRRILEKEYDIPMTQMLDLEVTEMCNLSSGIWRDGMDKGEAKGRTEGRAEERLENIMNLMQSLGITAEQAMNLLRIPEEERQSCRQELGN